MKESRALFPILMHEVRLDAELQQLYGERMLRTTLRLETRLNELVSAGRLRPLNTVVVSRAILGSYLGFMLPCPDPRLESLSPEEAVASLIDLYWQGLRMLPGEQAEADAGDGGRHELARFSGCHA
jgi:hypothetical protein